MFFLISHWYGVVSKCEWRILWTITVSLSKCQFPSGVVNLMMDHISKGLPFCEASSLVCQKAKQVRIWIILEFKFEQHSKKFKFEQKVQKSEQKNKKNSAENWTSRQKPAKKTWKPESWKKNYSWGAGPLCVRCGRAAILHAMCVK
jgi:hypothetical protein